MSSPGGPFRWSGIAGSSQLVADPDPPGTGDERADREAGVAFARERAQDVEISLDPARLRPRGHHAALDPHADLDRRLAELDPAPDERVLALAVEQDVGAEAARIPITDAGAGDEREARVGVVVEGAGRTLPGGPVALGLVLEVDDVLEGEGVTGGRATQPDGAAEPVRQRGVVVGDRAVGQRDLDATVLAQARAREQQLRLAARGQAEAGREVVDREPAVA